MLLAKTCILGSFPVSPLIQCTVEELELVPGHCTLTTHCFLVEIKHRGHTVFCTFTNKEPFNFPSFPVQSRDVVK